MANFFTNFLTHYTNNPNYLVIVLILNLILDALVKLIVIILFQKDNDMTSFSPIVLKLSLVSIFFLLICLMYMLFLHAATNNKTCNDKKINDFCHLILNFVIIILFCELETLPLKVQNCENSIFEGLKIGYIVVTFLNKLEYMLSKYFLCISTFFYVDFRVTEQYEINLFFLLTFTIIWLFYLLVTSKFQIPFIKRKTRSVTNKKSFSFKSDQPFLNNSDDFVLNPKICKLLFEKTSECIMVLNQNLHNLYQNKAFLKNFNISKNHEKPLNFHVLINKVQDNYINTSPVSPLITSKMRILNGGSPSKQKSMKNSVKNMKISENQSYSLKSYVNQLANFEDFIKILMKSKEKTVDFTDSFDLSLMEYVTADIITDHEYSLLEDKKNIMLESNNHMMDNKQKLIKTVNNKLKLYHFMGKNTNILVILWRPNKGFNDNLEKTIENQNKVLSFVSHEFRTPLNCINAMLQSLENNVPNMVYDQFIQPALSSGKYLMNMIQDILDMTQIKAGKFRLLDMDFDLNLLLKDIFVLFQVQAKTKKIDTSFEISPKVPNVICSDPNRLKQIIINLLGNAFKYTQTGSIKLKIEPYLDSSSIIRLTVEDTGLGVKDENKCKLLKAFGRIDDDKNKQLNPQGVGLGLIISQDISKALASDLKEINDFEKGLQFESEYGKGSKFYFLFQNKKNDYLPEDIANEIYESESPEFKNKELKKIDKENCKKFIGKCSMNTSKDMTPYFPPNRESLFKRNKHQSGLTITHAPTANDVICSVNFTKEDSIKKNSNSGNMGFSLGESHIIRNCSQITIRPFGEVKITTPSQRASFFSDMSISFTSNSISNRSKLQELKTKFENFPTYLTNKRCNCPDLLVVDDDSYNILALQFLIESLNLCLDTTMSGDDALDRIKKLYNSKENCCKFYKLVFLDIEMPVKDGLDTCREIKSYLKEVKGLEETKVIACTGYNDVDMNEKIKKAGFDNHLVKPILKGALIGILAEYLNEKKKKN